MTRPFHSFHFQPQSIPEFDDDGFGNVRPQSLASTICFISQVGLRHERYLFDPEPGAGGGGTAGGSAGGGEPGQGAQGGDGGTGGGPRMLSQEEVDRLIGKRLGEERKKYADYDQLKEAAARAKELEARNQELEEANLSKDEKERKAAERARAQQDRLNQENAAKISAAEKERDTWREKFLSRVVSDQLGSALDTAKVLGQARTQAIRAFLSDSEIEKDDDGNIQSITYSGIPYETPAKAAEAFLKANPFYASPAFPGGTGTRAPNAGGSPLGDKKLHELTEDELLQMDAQQRGARR